jgi:hypothetical protein
METPVATRGFETAAQNFWFPGEFLIQCFSIYTYGSVTDAEIGRYIAFASSPAGKNYHNATISGLKKAMLEGAYKWGESIADFIKQSAGETES